jgi:tetratricopeptide (TPR) repeat protein
VSYAFHYDFAISFLIFTALVNIHHFMLDGAIWKLRDSRIASLLIDKRARSDSKTAKARTSWIGGQTFGAHAVRVGLALMLFLWGGVDQVRYFAATDEGNLPRLLDAASMNPYDSALEMRIARADAQAGRSDDQLEALGRAIELNPSSPMAQQTQGRALIEAGRFQDAYDHYKQMVAQFPRDPDALVNFGLLAARLGHTDEAIESWERAIDVDHNQVNAQLYLAEALDRTGQFAAAATHFEEFLELSGSVDSQRSNQQAAARQRVMVMIELADAERQTRQSEQALNEYRAAAALAQQMGDLRDQSIAQSHLADTLDATGKASDAAIEYQRALTLDEHLKEPGAEAADWFNYGQFLARHSLPARFAYASYLHAEQLLTPTPGEELNTIESARHAAETQLAAEASAVKKDLDAVLSQAKSLPASAFASSR